MHGVNPKKLLGVRVHDQAPRAVVKLQVAAACGVDVSDERTVRGNDVIRQLLVSRVVAAR